MGPILLMVFSANDWLAAECTLSKHTENERVGVVDIWDVCAAIQRDLDRLKRQASKLLIKFNKGMWEILHVVKDNTIQWSRLGPDSLRNGPGRQKMSKKWTWASKASVCRRRNIGGILPTGQEKWSLHSTHCWWDHIYSNMSKYGLASTRETWTYQSDHSKGSQRLLREYIWNQMSSYQC